MTAIGVMDRDGRTTLRVIPYSDSALGLQPGDLVLNNRNHIALPKSRLCLHVWHTAKLFLRLVCSWGNRRSVDKLNFSVRHTGEPIATVKD